MLPGFFAVAQGQRAVEIPLVGEVDEALYRQLRGGLQYARQQKAAVVVLHVNTYGGEVQAADSMRTLLLRSSLKTIAFINPNAASAGALISLACDAIYLAPGAAFGAATVVDGRTGVPAPPKYQSYMSELMAATAHAKGRRGDIARKMVDPKGEIPGLVAEDQVLSLSADRALALDYAEGTANSVEEVLVQAGYGDAKLLVYVPTFWQKAMNVLLSDFATGLLVLLLLGGLWLELKIPGFGLPGGIAVLAGALLFLPHYAEGLADWWEMGLFGLGIVLLLAEVFVIPGFGVAGISGILATVAGLTAALLRNEGTDFSGVEESAILRTAGLVVGSLVMSLVGVFAVARYLLKNPGTHPIVDHSSMAGSDGYTVRRTDLAALIGQTVTAITDLRPGGTVQIEDLQAEARALKGYQPKGTALKVLEVRDNVLVVGDVD